MIFQASVNKSLDFFSRNLNKTIVQEETILEKLERQLKTERKEKNDKKL
jgi:hypothetical protein